MAQDLVLRHRCGDRQVVPSTGIRFFELPAELRVKVYQFFFGQPTLIYLLDDQPEEQRHRQRLRLSGADDEGAAAVSTCKDMLNLLLASKAIYEEAAPELYSSAKMVTGVNGFLEMAARKAALRVAQTQDLRMIECRNRPESVIKSLTICLSSHKKLGHVGVSKRRSELRAVVAKLEHSFPKLEELVICANQYADLVEGGPDTKGVAPMVFLRRSLNIRFVAGDIVERRRTVAAGERIKNASRLRIEEAILAALEDILSRRVRSSSATLDESQQIDVTKGEESLRDRLAHVLKERYRVKVLKLI